MANDDNVAALEVSEKRMRIGGGDDDDQQRSSSSAGSALELRIRFKDFYIIHAGKSDYTGLRVWPGAELLAAFVHASGRAGLLSSLCTVELGAGVGLGGLVAAHYVRHAILTDRVAVLLDLMRDNVQLNALQNTASVANLDWGVEGATALLRQYAATAAVDATSEATSAVAAAAATASVAADSSTAAIPAVPFVWDASAAVIIAADVVYPDTSDEALKALFLTVDKLLSTDGKAVPIPPDDSSVTAAAPAVTPIDGPLPLLTASALPFPLRGSFVCAYLSRDSDTSRRLLMAAAEAGFEAATVPAALFDRRARDPDQFHGVQGALLMFRKAAGAVRMVTNADPATLSRAVVAALTEGEQALTAPLPAFMLQQPELLRLWAPEPSHAELALDELEQLNEDNVLAGFGGGGDSD